MASGSTATSSSITQNHSAPSSYAFFTPAEKPPAPPRFSVCGAYTTRDWLPSPSTTVLPHRSLTLVSNSSTMPRVSSDCSLSTTMIRHGACSRARIESNNVARSFWRLYVVMTMASLLIVAACACSTCLAGSACLVDCVAFLFKTFPFVIGHIVPLPLGRGWRKPDLSPNCRMDVLPRPCRGFLTAQ